MEWSRITKSKKRIVFVGESGCGKTELALNCALSLKALYHEQKNICFFDMDQTKGTFRARNQKQLLEEEKIEFLCGEHFLDAPVIPPGVLRKLKEENTVCIFDVGGNEIGALSMGQFMEDIEADKNIVIFVINPYRLLSEDALHVGNMIQNIKAYGGFENLFFIGNPNMGEYTDSQVVEDGKKKINEIAEELNISCDIFAFPEWLKDKIAGEEKGICIRRFLCYP